MTEHDKIFDRDLLDRRFREATALPNTTPDDKDWWTLWHRHLADRKSPVWFYSYETADKFASQWPALTLRWRTVAEELLQDIQLGDFRPPRFPNGDIDWGGNPAKSMNWAGFHYFSWTNPLIRANLMAVQGDPTHDIGILAEQNRISIILKNGKLIG